MSRFAVQVDAETEAPRRPAHSEFAEEPFVDGSDGVGVVDEDSARTLAPAPQGDVNVFAAGEVVASAAVGQHRHHAIDDVVPGGNVKAPSGPSPGVVRYQKLIPEPASIEEPTHEGVDRPHECIGRMPPLHRWARCAHGSIQPVSSRPGWRSAQQSFG